MKPVLGGQMSNITVVNPDFNCYFLYQRLTSRYSKKPENPKLNSKKYLHSLGIAFKGRKLFLPGYLKHDIICSD